MTDKQQNMMVACSGYVKQPLNLMTNRQARMFATRIARNTPSINMDIDEQCLFAGSIYASIRYFNQRDAKHAEHMQYLQECEAARRDAARQREEEEKRRKQAFVIMIK